jgi:hypothetical protein
LRIKQNNQQRATVHTIKKWIQATSDFEKARFAIPITRLTSIKSGCVDEVAAAKFALFNISCQGDYTNTTSQERAIAPREIAPKLHSFPQALNRIRQFFFYTSQARISVNCNCQHYRYNFHRNKQQANTATRPHAKDLSDASCQ